MSQRLLAFDFDGTITDLSEVAVDITNRILGDLGIDPLTRAEMEELRSMPIPRIINKLGIPLYKVPRVATLGRKYLHEARETVVPIKGLPEYLKELAADESVVLCIVTSNTKPNVEAFLKQHDLEGIFSHIEGNASLFNKSRKLKGLLRKVGVSPDAAVMIGDEPRDVDAGRKAGTGVVAVTWGLGNRLGLEKAGAVTVVGNASELRKVLQ